MWLAAFLQWAGRVGLDNCLSTMAFTQPTVACSTVIAVPGLINFGLSTSGPWKHSAIYRETLVLIALKWRCIYRLAQLPGSNEHPRPDNHASISKTLFIKARSL